MRIPRKDVGRFVREIADQCMSSRIDRTNRGLFFQQYASTGSSDPGTPAMFNKTYASIDDLDSLLFSPVSLRFHISDNDIPNIVNEAKCRAAASKIRHFCRQSDSDTLISQAVGSGLVKGIGLTKQLYKDEDFGAYLVEPENFGVFRENHNKLDKDMEAFSHSMLITRYQFERLIAGRPDEAELRKKARKYMRQATGGLADTRGSAMNIVVGGIYPLQAAGQNTGANPSRGIVDWMSQPKPSLDPAVEAEMLDMQEVWIWDDERDDWATFQIIGSDILLLGRYQILNALAYDPNTGVSSPTLKGVHPFSLFCPNPIHGYFWGWSEIAKLIFLQEAINARIIGMNKMLRKQEDPSTKFVGSTGVNQMALSRFNKPGGYYTDSNPNAKIERDTTNVPQDLWMALHEYERMFDELMGIPPIAKGMGESGVRSAQHAETLVRMFSPRFKDRALLIERNVEEFGALTLDLARAHVKKKMIAWVPREAAGVEASDPAEDKFLIPPAKGLAPVYFTFADLPKDVSLTVDAHSSSPAFSAEAKGLAFDLLKVGAMSPLELIDHVDAPNPDELQAGIIRRDIAKAEAHAQEQKMKLLQHMRIGGGGKK